ncbi:substrate-binding domain-containing protein, partial [Rhizobiaceae sp. 2RAB30]
MRLAVEHLYGLGHRHIGHIAGPQHLSTGFLRRQGFEETTGALGLAADIVPVEVAEALSRSAGAEAAVRLLAKAPQLTAIVAANDLVALGAYD